MPRGQRERPRYLGAKLKQIRSSLGLSQSQMVTALGADDRIDRSIVSGWERGVKEPTLPILLKYAKLAGISTDVLIDDAIKLK